MSETGSAPRRPGCGWCVARGIGWALLLLVATAVLWYANEVYRCSQLQPSGDALFDRYAQAVVERQAWRLFRGGETRSATLPDEQLASWEGDFGDDPRYWQLRYWCASLGELRPTQQSLIDDEVDRQLRLQLAAILQQAVDRGCADARVYLQLYMLRANPSRRDYSEDELRSQQTLLNDAAEAEPDTAWPYYFSAIHRINLADEIAWLQENATSDTDEVVLAASLFSQGNAAADCISPVCFPYSYVAERISSTNEAPGNRIIAGSILSAGGIGFGPYNSGLDNIRIKECVRRVIKLDGTASDHQLLQGCVGMICRYGLADDADTLDWLSIAVMCQSLANHITVAIMPEVAVEQRAAVLELCKELNGVALTTVMGAKNEQLALTESMWPYMRIREAWRAVSGHHSWWDGPPHLVYEHEARLWIDGHPGSERNRQRLERIAQFDFETMGFIEDAPAGQVPTDQ